MEEIGLESILRLTTKHLMGRELGCTFSANEFTSSVVWMVYLCPYTSGNRISHDLWYPHTLPTYKLIVLQNLLKVLAIFFLEFSGCKSKLCKSNVSVSLAELLKISAIFFNLNFLGLKNPFPFLIHINQSIIALKIRRRKTVFGPIILKLLTYSHLSLILLAVC